EYKIEKGITEYSNLSEPRSVDKPVTSLDPAAKKSTTDHSKLKELEGPFFSGPEVTRACLGCHNMAGHQLSNNKHWTWSYDHPVTGQKLGKNVLVNNFCTNARGNEGMCAQCHAGYGWKDDSFDFTNFENMDCLACHESTGTYYKTPTTDGNEACSIMFEGKAPLDWTSVAQSVGMPSRSNCGSCHFFGGGGDNVKHGDLSSALLHPDKSLDVHMDENGLNFACTICHVGEGHEWSGSRYMMKTSGKDEKPLPGMQRETASCASCHGEQPHPSTLKGIKLNQHTDRVACETCHIPEFARGGVATKVDWDWREAGKLKDGVGYNEEGYTQGNGKHRHTYKSIKGSFKYGENLQPEYHWFNGVMDYTTIDTVFDPSNPVAINAPQGSADDPDAKIWPFKAMHTMQPYDKGNNTLVYMYLWGDDDKAFWGNYDFDKAIRTGMQFSETEYSGEYGFVETLSYWPINHMVAPKEDALECQACHSREGRLAEVKGVFLPGRDSPLWLDRIGMLLVLGTLGGVVGHGVLKKLTGKRGTHS
ncbi:MAG: tetrathionate reductase family octaheme c-type cytochrome, partial [Gammaproteobacteria bacterium]|nr:tetrathionate reductase family octaheme c-type cytochrome [Gammaproteobacteria bacterium]